MTSWKNAATEGPIFSPAAISPPGRPFAVAAVGARHMIGDGGMATPIGCTGVARDPLTFVKDLDNLVGGADIDEFKDQGMDKGWNTNGHRSRRDSRGRRGNASSAQKRMAGPAAHLGEQFGAAGAETAHLAGVEFDDQHPNSGIEFCQGKETLVAQAGQDPALCNLHGDLNLRLVLWPPRPCREDRGAIMAGHLGIGAVDPGIVAIWVGHGGLQIIADDELWHTT